MAFSVSTFSGTIHHKIVDGRDTSQGSYNLPFVGAGKVKSARNAESVFRRISTSLSAEQHDFKITVRDTKDLATFVPENGEIPIYDGMSDYNELRVGRHKLAVMVKYDSDFIYDASFNFESSLSKRLGENFALAEDKAFINGTGVDEPIGILNPENGANVGTETANLSFNDVTSLYLSVDKRYRKHGTWLMNDETALALRKLTDKDGNYLWNHSNDTIFGKPVTISEFMPSIGAGSKPIAFGDFSYYWILDRKGVSVRPLFEKFAALSQVAYLAMEFLDGKLIRSDAIKVVLIKSNES